MKLLLLFFIFSISTVSFSLEIDEKLTLRFLDVSSTKKTVLINRGIEDGLVVGDHAKFFKTTGVGARGVVIKVSPTRSIWSLYRIIEPGSIVKNHVLSLKISAPVKITKDPSRAIVETEASTGIAVAEGADDLPKDLSKGELDDLKSLSEEPGSQSERTAIGVNNSSLWELFASMSYNPLSSNITAGTSSLSGSTTTILGGGGVEKYFSGVGSLIDNLSLYGFAEITLAASHDIDVFDPSSIMLYGGGLSFHFINSPLSYGAYIPYLTVNGGMGVASTTYDGVASTGSVSFFNAGCGLKYNLKSGFGVRGTALYSSRGETYNFEGGSIDQLTINHTGFGISGGISYRF